MIGFLLNILAGILLWLLRRVAWLYGALFSGDFNKYNKDIAVTKDRLGNVICAPLLNRLLITKDGYKFGNGKETISSAIGKNFVKGTLTKHGMFWYNFLEKRQKNHSIKAIDNNVKKI